MGVKRSKKEFKKHVQKEINKRKFVNIEYKNVTNSMPLMTRLSWLMPWHSQCNISHRPLDSIQLCLMMIPPSSSSCIWSSPFISLSLDPFSRYQVASFLCGLVMCTVVPAWWCCQHLFSMCVQASSIFFFLAAAALMMCVLCHTVYGTNCHLM